MRFLCSALMFAAAGHLPMAQQALKPLSAETIMARVAANQDQSQAEREHYVYVQHARVISRKGKTIQCEETTDSRVTPTGKGSSQQLLKLEGRLLAKHNQYDLYTQLPATKEVGTSDVAAHKQDLNISFGGGASTDRDLVENMRSNLTNSDTKDGLGTDLFPLTTKTQAEYLFHLAGQELMNGRKVFHVVFQPKDSTEFTWKGDAYIDTEAYQPVLVRTSMARKIPFAVRTLLGTSLPGLGFTVIYAPQPGGVWFPVSFGTEFKLHVLFFFKREITINAQNRDFERTHVTSTISPATY